MSYHVKNAINAVSVTALVAALGMSIASPAIAQVTPPPTPNAGPGCNYGATGVNSLQCGEGATAGGPQATAVGFQATALQEGDTAIGAGTHAEGGDATALGNQARAPAVRATALGANSNATFDGSTAVGFGAATNAENQVSLGGVGSSVRIGDIAASTNAQEGDLAIVTVDANGTLGRNTAIQTTIIEQNTRLTAIEQVNTTQDNRLTAIEGVNAAQGAQIGALQEGQDALFDLANMNRRDIGRANEGVAMALAMESPYLPDDAKVAVAGGIGYFADRVSISAAVTARTGRMSSVSAGVGVGAKSGKVGARAGFQTAW